MRAVWCLLTLLAMVFASHGAAPALVITNLPAFGTFGNLQGSVLGAGSATQTVAVFIYVPGYGWVTKPTCAQPLSAMQTNGAWSADIVTANSDTNATRFAALLVNTNFNEPCVLGLANLPTNLYALAPAKSVVTRPSPGVRFFSFCGYDWWVKTSATPVGPGPNYFSDNMSNVWTDANGWLHLRITHRTNAWPCAEVISARTFGPGSYRFELNSPVDSLNQNVTIGLFNWSDDPVFTDREIDVECGRWENPSDTNNAQFVVQPYNVTNHLVRYRVPAGMTNMTHLFVWETNRVSFQCQAGAYSAAATNLIASYVFTNAADVPQSGDECVHMNLWLVSGNPPTDSKEVEVIIKGFSFVPLGTAPPPILQNPRLLYAGPLECDFTAQPDFHYMVQMATNFVQWNNLMSFVATNGLLTFEDTNFAANRRFYRVEAQP